MYNDNFTFYRIKLQFYPFKCNWVLHLVSRCTNISKEQNKQNTTTLCNFPINEGDKQGGYTNKDKKFLRIKIEFPRWDCMDPIGQVSRAKQYFWYHQTTKDHTVAIASINLEGDVIQWYDWFTVSSYGVLIWREFIEALMMRFKPLRYEDVHGELAKMRQITTILEYQGHFERLSYQARDQLEPQLNETFVTGFHLDIRQEVKMYMPCTMQAAISFA